MSKGAGEAPVVWAGEYDPTLTYLPRQLVSVAGTPYMSLAKQTGVDPPGASWLAFGGAGGSSDGFRPGSGTYSTVGGDLYPDDIAPALATDLKALAVGSGALAAYRATAMGTDSTASADYTTAYGESSTASGGPGNTTYGQSSAAIATGGGQASAFGHSAFATYDHATALGATVNARGSYCTAAGFGADAGSSVHNSYATSYGANSAARGTRSVALGYGANASDDDLGVVKVDSWEVYPSSGAVETGLIVHDSSGVRWRWTPDSSGALVVTAA